MNEWFIGKNSDIYTLLEQILVSPGSNTTDTMVSKIFTIVSAVEWINKVSTMIESSLFAILKNTTALSPGDMYSSLLAISLIQMESISKISSLFL